LTQDTICEWRETIAFSVLSAKLHKPQLSDNVISRAELLKDCHRAKVILVSAQAGSGKSTIISAWLSEQDRPYSWYSLDEWDNDLTQFFAYFIAGIKSIDRQAAESLEQLLEAFQSVGFESFMRALVHQLHSIDRPFILVLDDYHVIRNDQIHQVLRTILEHLPQSMQLVLVTREDPPFSLAKLRASKGLFELRISQLRFTEDEVRAFFSQQRNLTLEDEQLQHLIKRTEGWVAGLQLTALSMQGQEDIGGFIEAFTESHYYIMDYLMEEVLDHQAPEIKDFLLKTSIFEFFSVELCEAVLELKPGEGSAIIEKLVKANSFIIPTESSRKWYRYHNLFRDLLRQRLEHEPEMDLDKPHHRAGCWFKNEGRDQEAIYHFLKANASEEAAAMIECKWVEMDLQLQAASWLNMAKQLPAVILERSPVLAMGYGWALLDTGDIEGSGVWLDKAQVLYDQCQSAECPEGILISDTLQFDLLPATIASARGYSAAAKGDIEGTLKYTRDALMQIPSDQHLKRSLVAMTLAVAHWGKGEFREAEAVIIQCLEDIGRAVNPPPLVYNSIYMVLGELYILQERLNEASELFKQLISRVKKENQVPILLASLYLGLAKIAFLQGDNQQAYALLEDSKAHGQNYSLMYWKYKYYLMLARVYCNEGFYDLARDCVLESKAHYFMNPMPDDITFDDMETMIDQAETSGYPIQRSMDGGNNEAFSQDLAKTESKGFYPNKLPLLKKEYANHTLVESLTVRELEVLALIASGLSNQEICNTLFLALSTVKGYNQTIYGKLQVKRRTEAVARAKELGLV
jgi:LuxR family maltose regulon positive regulatory protein